MPDRSFLGGLPRRDLWLLPLTCMLTVLAMLIVAEIAAQRIWPEQLANSCTVPDDALGFRYRPNCTSRMKGFEGPWYTNSYNDCGYRAAASCGSPPPGTRRIAVVGSSLSEGHLVAYANTAGAHLAGYLGHHCPFPVEAQNLAARRYTGWRTVLRMREALTLHPQAVLMLVAPFDVESQLDDATLPITTWSKLPPARMTVQATSALPPMAMLAGKLAIFARQSRAVMAAQSFLIDDPASYLQLFLRYGDKADFLRPPFTAEWQERLRRFDLLIGNLAQQAHEAGTTFTLVFAPNQAQLTLMEPNTPAIPGIDPRALPRALAAIVARHGGDFVDASTSLAKHPDPLGLFYRVDGHPSGLGQEVIADAVAQHYMAASGGPFASCTLAPQQETQR